MTWFAMIGKWFIDTKFGRWIVGIGVFLAAIAAACLYWFERGKRTQATKDKAKDAEASQRAAQEAADAAQRSADAVRATNDEISKLPDAGTQRVGDAAPDTAAGWLREHADRDQAGP